MTKKRELTAAELMARLQQNPAYLRAQSERQRNEERRRAEILSALDPVVRDLREAGQVVDSIDDLAARRAPLDEVVVSVLRRWMLRIENERAQEQIVRALAAARPGFPGRELREAFDHTADQSLRWAIANTIASARPSGIAEWVRERVQDPSTGKAREMLAIAVACLLPSEEAKEVLRSLLGELPGYVAMALAEIGDETDLTRLEDFRDRTAGWQYREVAKAIKSIRQRLRK